MTDTIKYQFAGFTFSPNEYQLKSPKGRNIRLSSGVNKLLQVFVENYGSVLSIDFLIEKVWDGHEETQDDAVQRRISALRKTLEKTPHNPVIIVTVRKKGYTLATEVKRIEPIDKRSLSVINHSQTSSQSDADIYQELAEIKSEMRRMDAKINYLASWMNFMWEAIPESKRARIIYETVQRANQRLIGTEQEIQISVLDSLEDRIQDTFSHYRKTSSERELGLAVNMSRFWNSRGYLSKGCAILQAALSRHSETISETQAMGFAWLSNLLCHSGDYESAEQSAVRSIQISKQMDSEESSALSIFTLGMIAQRKGKYERARSYFTNCLHIAQRANFGWLTSWSFLDLGIVARDQENYSYAESWFLKSLTKREEIEDLHGLAMVQAFLSGVTYAQGNIKQAKHWADRSMEGQASKWVRANYQSSLGNIEKAAGQHQAAYDFYQKSLRLWQEIGDKRGQARAIERMASATSLTGNDKEAAGLFGSADQIRTAISAPRSPAEQREYGANSLSLKKKYLAEFERGSERLSEITTAL